MRRFLWSLLLSSLLLGGCATSNSRPAAAVAGADLPPPPPETVLASASVPSLAVIPGPPILHLRLTWKYPYDDPALKQFTVWKGDSDTPLTPFGATANTFFDFQDQAPMRWFSVSATHD